MDPVPVVSDRKDSEKSGAELVEELNALRDINSRLEGVVKRYEKREDKRDLNGSRSDLEAGKDIRSRVFFTTLLTQAPLGFAYLDRDLRYVIINEKLAYLNDISVADHIGKRFEDIMPGMAPEVRKIVDRILATGRPVKDVEIGAETARMPGIRRYWNESWFPVQDDTGEIAGFGAIVEEITDRKRSEEALTASEKQYRVLVESANSIILRWDVNNRITFINEYGRQFFGYAPAEIIGQNVNILVPETETTGRKLGSLIDEIGKFPERYLNNVNENFRKNGERVWVSWTNKALYDKNGNLVEVLAIGNDITVLRKAEEAVRNSERLYRAIGESIDYGVWVCDPDGRNVYASESFLKLVGMTQQQCSDFGWSYVLHHDDAERTIAAWKECVRTGGRWDIKHRYLGVDGHYHPILARGVPVRDEKGQIVCWAGINLDISGIKQTEDELQDAKATAELYLDLMGHDINNLHQIALGYLELARDLEADGGRTEFLDKPIEVLQRSARLIQNVRKLQKLQDGIFQTQEVDICEVLADVQREFGAVPRKTITLNLNGIGHCEIRANELLHDVFANLVSNAIKHTGDKADIVIDLAIVGDAGCRQCRISVEDNGPGIVDDFKGRIFNRMLKGSPNVKGMGLGLYLVKSLVESYAGKVWVDDRVPGDHTRGARFVVTLPVFGAE